MWGCLCFYPYFYSVGLWGLVDYRPLAVRSNLYVVLLWLSVLCFVAGNVCTRGANLQKYLFKRYGQEKGEFLGIRPVLLGGKLLVSGFWGLSRHINYLGEVLQGVGLALPATAVYMEQGAGIQRLALAWMYPVYYCLLLGARERDDHKRCEKKYGRSLWAAYCKRVPWRIVPWVY